VLKQDQYVPFPLEKQILIIYAGNRGFLDELPVRRIRQYEGELYAFMERERPDVLRQIAEKKTIDAALDGAIAAALQEFNSRFTKEE
jgi:F-type H+-transporting ATPase subunit alpha